MSPVPPDLQPAAERITVVTYNIHHGAGVDRVVDLGRIAGVLDEIDADLIGLQEVDDQRERTDFVDQAAWLGQRLSMDVSFSVNKHVPPPVGQSARGQYGTAILSRHTLRNCLNTSLPNHLGGEQRGLAQADVTVRGVDLRFFNTHLTHTSHRGRVAQARAINEIIGQADDGRRHVVLVGDLNAGPTSEVYAVLTERMSDVWTAVGEGKGRTTRPWNPTRRIDYIMVSDAITPVSATVVKTNASDHLPIVAELALPHPRRI